MTKAAVMGTHTLVGFGRSLFPRDAGNCFSVGRTPWPANPALFGEWVETDMLRVVNVHYENFAELQYRQLIRFPIEIEMIGDRLCAITDERVPNEWKLKEPCTSCVREEFLEAAKTYCRKGRER